MPEDEDAPKPPEHLAIMSSLAQAYRSSVDRIKRGGKTGISRAFGGASELLPISLQESTPHPGTDIVYCVCPEDEIAGRTLYLAHLTHQHCLQFLNSYLQSCRNGEFGDQASRLLETDLSSQTFNQAIKELTCVSVYLILFDIGTTTTSSQWLKDFLGGGLGATDYLIAEPSVAAIMTFHESVVRSYTFMCKRVSLSVCMTLGLTSAGWAAQAAINDYLLSSVSVRRDIMRRALEEAFSIVEGELRADLT